MMNISHISTLDFQFIKAYGISCARLAKPGDRNGLYPTFCCIPQGKSTVFNHHFESELFYIVQGIGMMRIEQETRIVTTGHLIQIPSFAKHSLQNTGNDDLIFLSIYSEDFSTLSLPPAITITTAPPTPNGALHLGHISGPYLAADVLGRYLRCRGLAVSHHSGTDDHQNDVYEKAHASNIAPHIFQQNMRKTIQDNFSTMQITFDTFLSPATDLNYQHKILAFVKRAIRLNIIEKEQMYLPYCINCDEVLVNAAIQGNCPFCESISHGACENCGIVVTPDHLNHSICTRCNITADKKICDVYTFSLNHYLPLILGELKKKVFSEKIQTLIKKVSTLDNVKILLSYPNKNCHGLTIPNTDQTLDPWFEMAAHYEQFALSSQYWVHCFGFDNSFYYLLFIPALLKSMHEKSKMPDAIITNDFLQWNGLKFSTSKQHALFVNAFSGNSEHLRLYLICYRPALQTENFSVSAFEHFSAALEKQLYQLKSNAKRVAEYPKNLINPHKIIQVNRIIREIELLLSLDKVDFRCVGRQVLSFIDLVLQSKNMGNTERMMLHVLATILLLFMPKTSQEFFNLLKEESLIWIQDWSTLYVTA